MGRRQVNDPTAPCVKCGAKGQYSKQLCSACHQRQWYAAKKAPPQKAVPPEHAAEVETLLNGLVDAYWERKVPEYKQLVTTECMDELDRLEIEAAAKEGWGTMVAKAKEEMRNAKTFREAGQQRPICCPNRTDIGRRRGTPDDE
jgi:hypothetical protein